MPTWRESRYRTGLTRVSHPTMMFISPPLSQAGEVRSPHKRWSVRGRGISYP